MRVAVNVQLIIMEGFVVTRQNRIQYYTYKQKNSSVYDKHLKECSKHYRNTNTRILVEEKQVWKNGENEIDK